MNRETRVCPLCNGTLHFRLGEYICDSCEYRAPVELPKADDLSRKDDELKDRRARLIKPPPSPVEGKKVFSPQDIDTTARVKFKDSDGKPPPEAKMQKLVVLSLMLLMSAISILMSLPQQQQYAFAYGQGATALWFLAPAIGIVLWGWALFTENLVVKYIFIVLSALNLLGLVAGVILLIYASNSNVVMTPGALMPYLSVTFYIMLVAGLWINGWIFMLLYNDINAMN